ncbi:hypothetical protein MMC21_006155 [Puttea exsequens]|nr:hypothetical protein [Puttea exsequens]
MDSHVTATKHPRPFDSILQPTPVPSINTNGHAFDPEHDARESNHPSHTSPASDASSSTRQIRRRNKPSLSCETCTVKKTKCDRTRPACFACVKRKSECHYSQLADLIEESHRALGVESPRKRAKSGTRTVPTFSTPNNESNGMELPDRKSSTGSSPMLLSNIPFSHGTGSNIFKSEHPFVNYWTAKGGLKEVIDVLPSKDQADILVAKYFEAVDPVYPMIHRETFHRDYDIFWAQKPTDVPKKDGDLVALIFVILAMGTQFVAMPSRDQKEQTAEFHVSASYQALRVFSYLARPSMRSIQTMILLIYFLMNDNHAADAFAFAGIVIRHAYALGLNREPSTFCPHTSPLEKQQRRKIWQAIYFQDTFLTILLALPPTATHTDVRIADLEPEMDNPFAPSASTDVSYISSMWYLARIVQSTLCTPRSLNLPICSSSSDRMRIVESFHRIYTSFPNPFRTFSEAYIYDLASRSKRLARQTLFLTSNYFHCLMLVYADQHAALECDVHGTLDAAHEAINSFFLLHTLFEDEARVWYHFSHRAFLEAQTIAEILKNESDRLGMDPIRMKGKNDILRMIGILQLSSDHDAQARTRVSVLSQYL